MSIEHAQCEEMRQGALQRLMQKSILPDADKAFSVQENEKLTINQILEWGSINTEDQRHDHAIFTNYANLEGVYTNEDGSGDGDAVITYKDGSILYFAQHSGVMEEPQVFYDVDDYLYWVGAPTQEDLFWDEVYLGAGGY